MADKTQPETVRFVYEKSPDYSMRYADGAIASPMPGGNLHLSFFLERQPYFQEQVHEVSVAGLGDEVSRKLEFEGICRHQEVGIVLTPAAAEKIVELIQNTLKQMKELNAKADKAKR